MWGLLNETPDGPAFRHAVAMLPLVRTLDDTPHGDAQQRPLRRRGLRQGIGSVAGLDIWPRVSPGEPWVGINTTTAGHPGAGHHLAAGPAGVSSRPEGRVQRGALDRARRPARVEVAHAFTGLAERATTDVHVLHNGRSLFDGLINLNDWRQRGRARRRVWPSPRATRSTASSAPATATTAPTPRAWPPRSRPPAGRTYDATAEFLGARQSPRRLELRPAAPGSAPDAATFALYSADGPSGAVGSSANPGSRRLGGHAQRPASSTRACRTPPTSSSRCAPSAAGDKPVFLSEYGIGSAVDLWRAVRHFEQAAAQGTGRRPVLPRQAEPVPGRLATVAPGRGVCPPRGLLRGEPARRWPASARWGSTPSAPIRTSSATA